MWGVEGWHFPWGFSHLLLLTIQPPPSPQVILLGSCFCRKQDYLSARGRFLNTGYNRCSSVLWLLVESGEELQLPSNEKHFSIIETPTECSVFGVLVTGREVSLTKAGTPCTSDLPMSVLTWETDCTHTCSSVRWCNGFKWRPIKNSWLIGLTEESQGELGVGQDFCMSSAPVAPGSVVVWPSVPRLRTQPVFLR